MKRLLVMPPSSYPVIKGAFPELYVPTLHLIFLINIYGSS
jgi:hypothetical protein